MQLNFKRGRARQTDNVFNTARQPVFVLHYRDDDLGNSQSRDGQVIGPQTKGCFTNQPRNGSRQQTTNGPCNKHGQPKATKVTRRRRVNFFNQRNRRIKQRSVNKETNDNDRQNRHGSHPTSRHLFQHYACSHNRSSTHQKRANHRTTTSLPCTRRCGHRYQDSGQTTKGHKPHNADIKQTSKTPL